MYLINTTTLELKFFIDAENCPPYAILSHRWTDDEINYKDFVKGRRKDSLGYKKIEKFCEIVRNDKSYHFRMIKIGKRTKDKDEEENLARQALEWAWVDTCCIDKRSSAELQEAINSMYSYYQEAAICYAYLADLNSATTDEQQWTADFEKSEWFTRGWTLQELIAPRKIRFFSGNWTPMGYIGKPKEPGNNLITNVTRASGIDKGYLLNTASRSLRMGGVSIALKMSWASSRTTTRAEDMTYCLLGLFNVNMPLLYGEGAEKAFLRLQEEIMKRNDDYSLFMWSWSGRERDYHQGLSPYQRRLLANVEHPMSRTIGRGLLAPSPSWFLHSHVYKYRTPERAIAHPRTLTHRGMRIVLPLLYWVDDIYFAILDDIESLNTHTPIIILKRLARDSPVFHRIFCKLDLQAPSPALGGSFEEERSTALDRPSYRGVRSNEQSPYRWENEAVYIRQQEDFVWSKHISLLFLPEGTYGEGYTLETVTSYKNDSTKIITNSSPHPSGFDLGRVYKIQTQPDSWKCAVLLISHDGELRDEHRRSLHYRRSTWASKEEKEKVKEENLVIEIRRVSALFIGFNASLANDLESQTGSVMDPHPTDWEKSSHNPALLSPLTHPRLRRFGSRICVPSVINPAWCHHVELSITGIENVGLDDYDRPINGQKYTLDLKLSYCSRASCADGGFGTGCPVVQPSGYTVKGERTSSS